MKSISHTVSLIQQGLQECVQACAAQLLQFYGINKNLEQIKKEVPVYLSKDIKPLGSSLGHIASYFIKEGFTTTIHTADVQIFDRSWGNLTNKEIIGKLAERKQHISHPIYGEKEFSVIFDGYISFLKAGGRISFPVITNKYLYNLLASGPIYAVVNYQFLNSSPKTNLVIETQQIFNDDVAGNTGTHAIIISGFNNGKYTIVDPDKNMGGVREIEMDHLLGSIYLAETDYDNILITLEQ